MIYLEMEAACITWKQKSRCCWSLADVFWHHLPQFSYSSSIVKGKIRHVVLLCMLCEQELYPVRSLPGAESSPSWIRNNPFWEENQGRNYHTGIDSTKGK